LKSTAERLLDRVAILRDSCDLDLLLFFARHPRTLITTEDLAQFVGYDLQRISRSLDALIAGGIVQRSQNDAHAARMYVLETTGPAGGWLPTLLVLASTREGRATIIAVLAARGMAGASDARSIARPKVGTRRLKVAHA
jgi:hypothetical protein